MAWTTPMTAVSGNAFNAADFNTYVRDNLNETMPGKATTSGRWFVSSAANTLAERANSMNYVSTTETTTSTSYADLATAGPALTVTTGTFAIVSLSCGMRNSTANAMTHMSFAISGATTLAAADSNALIQDGIAADEPQRKGVSVGVTLTGGSNTFTSKYKVAAGTGTFFERRLVVWTF